MHLSLRWGGGGCHGDMSTEKYEIFPLRTPQRQLRMRLLHNTELYRVNSDYPSAQALRYQNRTISVLCLLYMCMHRTKKTASVSAFMTKPGYGFSLRPRHLLKLELLKTKQM